MLRIYRLSLVLFFIWSAHPVTATDRPNVLVISVDTFRPDHLGAYGYERPTSPHIDTIAAGGVVFLNAYTTSAWTTPGLISLLTSLDAPSHGVDIRGKSIHPNVVTLADALRDGGYRAPDIFALTDIPNFHHMGFEPYPKRSEHIRRGGDEILFRWLEEEANRSDAPFFLYYHYRDLHQPYNPGPTYEELYLEKAFGAASNPLSWIRRFLAFEKMTLVKREVMMPRGIIDFAPWDKEWVYALYDAQIRRMDTEFFGRLRSVLRKIGLGDNTVIVITADHGEELLEHGLVGHVSTFKEGSLSEELVKIPLIFVGPGVQSGVQVETRVQVIDAMPTILELVGLVPDQSVQGRSLLPLAAGMQRMTLPLFFESTAGGYTASLEQYAIRSHSVISGDWKLISHTNSRTPTLFDLSTDPLEDHDLYQDEPRIAERLELSLQDWAQTSEPRIDDRIHRPQQQLSGTGQTIIEFPQHGDTLEYLGAEQTVHLKWSGEETASYKVLYDIGEGVYHLSGQMDLTSNNPSYGPFNATFWNSVVLYNPFTIRVHPIGQPHLISDPITFYLASSEGGSLAPAQILIVTKSIATEIATLAAGTILALVDLTVWIQQHLSAADVTAWALLLAIVGALAWPRLARFGERRVRAWLLALVYIGVVYATIPIFPQLWHGLRIHTGDSIRHTGSVIIGAIAIWSAWRLHKRVQGKQVGPYLLYAILLVAYIALLIRFGQFPAERLHLLEYGFMGVLLLRARTIDRPARVQDFVICWGLTVLIGCGDETIQWVLPQRYFELKDVGLNAVSCALGLCLSRLVTGGQQQ